VDYYSILGVPRDAGLAQIKNAYRKVARECHPDLHPNDPGAEERFKAAQEAYAVLSNAAKRAVYDTGGRMGRVRGSTPSQSASQMLADSVREQFTRYVAFHSEYYNVEADTLTLWVMHTHAFEATETTPYMLLMAPTEEAGKSRIIDVAQYLVRRASVVHDPTPASLFHQIGGLESLLFGPPTIFVDEVDMLYESQALKTVLNAGYRYGAYISRARTRYGVYCPKCFSGIAGRRPPVTGATLSRCVQIPIRTRAPAEPISKFFHRTANRECQPIHVRLEGWALNAIDTLADASPSMPSGLSDRQEECWEPLLAIADQLGSDWPDRARAAAMTLSARIVKQPTEGLAIIRDVCRVWDDIDGDRVHTEVLAARRNELADRLHYEHLSAQELSNWLTNRFEIHPLPNPFRLNGKLLRGYEREAFADARTRYR
jgi:hypothetical protein